MIPSNSPSRERRLRNAATKRKLYQDSCRVGQALTDSVTIQEIHSMVQSLKDIMFAIQSSISSSCHFQPWMGSDYASPNDKLVDDGCFLPFCPYQLGIDDREHVLYRLFPEPCIDEFDQNYIGIAQAGANSSTNQWTALEAQLLPATIEPKITTIPGLSSSSNLDAIVAPDVATDSSHSELRDVEALHREENLPTSSAEHDMSRTKFEVLPSVGTWLHIRSCASKSRGQCQYVQTIFAEEFASWDEEYTSEQGKRYDYAPLLRDAADVPVLAEKFERCLKTCAALPMEAFSIEQRHWLAKLIHDHTDYSSVAMCVADGLIDSHSGLLQELEREMRMELSDVRPQPQKRKRKGKK